jgi:hypothetical protein
LSARIQDIEQQLLVEINSKKIVENSFLSEKTEFESRMRELMGDVDRLNLNFQAAVTARDVAEEKVNTFNEQKKILVKEVKMLRKKLDATQQDYETVKAMNEQLSTLAGPLQKQNQTLTDKLVVAMAALKEAQAQLVLIQDANNAAEMAEEVAMKAAAAAQAAVKECNSAVAVGSELSSVDVAALTFDKIYPDLTDEGRASETGAAGESSRRNSATQAGNINNQEGDAGWLTPDKQHLLGSSGEATRRPSAFGGIFGGYDKTIARPILKLGEDGHSQPSASQAGITVGGDSSSSAPNYSATHAILQQMQPVEGKIYCLRCHGSVEGPKYSTCKCVMPALNQDMLHGDMDSGNNMHNSGSLAKVGTGVSNVGSSFFGLLKGGLVKASGAVGTAAVAARNMTATTSHIAATVPQGTVSTPIKSVLLADDEAHAPASSSAHDHQVPVQSTPLLDFNSTEPVVASMELNRFSSGDVDSLAAVTSAAQTITPPLADSAPPMSITDEGQTESL